jgi:hypothetical protein
LKSFGDIFLVVFLGVLSNFWLFAVTADKEQQASEDVSTLEPFPLSGNVYCDNK